MQTAVIIDVIVAAALFGFAVLGAYRGLFRTVAGLVIVIVSLIGANVLSHQLTPVVMELARPALEQRVADRVDSASGGTEDVPAEKPQLSPQPEAGDASSQEDPLTQLQAGEIMKLMGLDEQVIQSLSAKVEEKVRETGASIATAVAESLMESVLYILLFFVSFALLLLLLNIAARALNLILKLPGLNFLNRVGGLAVGILEGALIVFLVLWALRWLNVPLAPESVEQTHILRFFMAYSPLDLLSY